MVKYVIEFGDIITIEAQRVNLNKCLMVYQVPGAWQSAEISR